MASVTQLDRPGRVLLGSGLAFCAALLAFALCPWFWGAVGLLVAVGVATTVFTTLIATLIQLRVPGELRGRVMSLYAVTLIGLPSLGALGLASVAAALAGRGAGWARPALGLLDWVGVGGWTARLGTGAGPPRAVALCALILALVLAASAPMLRSRHLAQS
jgi:MFS family permease